MDKGAAAELLTSSNLNVRLRAARVLAKSATLQELEKIRIALSVETVSWVREALIHAESKANSIDSAFHIAEGPITEEESLVEDVYSKAVQDLARRFVHDIKRVIGYIDVKASKEILEYQNSETFAEVKRLTSLIQAIEKLSIAAATPSNTDFNLGDLIRNHATSESSGLPIEMRYAGSDPLIVNGDASLIGLVLTNAIRNSIESIAYVNSTSFSGEIVFNWGKTDKEFWFSVLDNGIGLPQGRREIFEMSQTDKKNHWGMGLYLAKTAVMSMKGTITLTNATDSGAALKTSWPIPVVKA